MRSFIRHPTDIPIEIQPQGPAAQGQGAVAVQEKELLNDIGVGGLSFRSGMPLDVGSFINIKISLVRPPFEARSRVIWCRKENGTYNIGAEFFGMRDSFKFRMVEQICHIEHYKKEAYEKEGRTLTGHEAALEWIKKYANSFHPELLEEKKN